MKLHEIITAEQQSEFDAAVRHALQMAQTHNVNSHPVNKRGWYIYNHLLVRRNKSIEIKNPAKFKRIILDSYNPSLVVNFATYILKARFPEGEPIIALRASTIIVYAAKVLNGRFFLAEKRLWEIGADGDLAYYKKKFTYFGDKIPFPNGGNLPGNNVPGT